MKKLVTAVSNVQVQLLFCCGAAVLLTACGGGTDFVKDQPTQTAAQSYDSGTSMSGATFGITDDAPAGTTITSGTEADSGTTIAPANDAPAPTTIRSSTKAAPGAIIKPRYDAPDPTTIPAGTEAAPEANFEPAYDAPAPTTIPSSAEAASDTGPDGSTSS
jgi:hypothetical protein